MLLIAVLLAAPPQNTFVAAPPQSTFAAAETGSYAEGVRRSLTEDKPLIVWVGGNFCGRCVEDTADEFVHVFVDSFEGTIAPSLVVAAPEGDGLTRVATVLWWIEGDTTWGHTASARRLLNAWKASGKRLPQAFQTRPLVTAPVAVAAGDACVGGSCSPSSGPRSRSTSARSGRWR